MNFWEILIFEETLFKFCNFEFLVNFTQFYNSVFDNDAINIIKVENQTTAITNPKCPDDIKSFTYDYSYNSFDPGSLTFANQEIEL